MDKVQAIAMVLIKIVEGRVCEEHGKKIRNQLIAHPKAREIISGTDVPEGKGLSGKGEPIKYKKLKNFPNILSEFTYEHPHKLYNEIKEFLMKYYSLLDKDLNNHWIASYFHLKNI